MKRNTTLEDKNTEYAERLGEYVTAAMADLYRYREALLDIEQSSSALPSIRSRARRALRNYRRSR